MNFSSPHSKATPCTFASLIQETTVCPPSRGLFFACGSIPLYLDELAREGHFPDNKKPVIHARITGFLVSNDCDQLAV
jgi:hypothetical protein